MEIQGVKYQMSHFRENPHTDQCELFFCLTTELPNLGTFSEEVKAVRHNTDTVSSLLQHIKNKILKLVQDKYNTDKQEGSLINEHFEIPVALKQYSKHVQGSKVLKDFSQTLVQKDVIFEIFDQKYIVLLNTPLIKRIKLPPVLYANHGIQPIKFHAIYTENNHSVFIWYKSLDKIDWHEVGRGFNYLTKDEDIGHYLKLVCVPYSASKLKGPEAEVISDVVVEEMKDLPRCPFERRHEFTKKKLSGLEFRVVSYNILAEKYTNIDENYVYCDPKVLAIDYRKQLILKELLGYNADIVCLQEVDNRHFTNYFKVNFKENGYYSFYHRKGNRIPEGLALFVDKTRFKLVHSKQIVFSEEIQSHRSYSHVWNLIKRNADLKKDFLKQSTSLQVTVLKPTDGHYNRHLIVANTHLYYHPEASHIRLIQVSMATTYLTSLKKKYQQSNIDVSVIFCGDFNSSVDRSLLPFMLQGRICPTHADCLKIDEHGKALLFHDFIFESACGTPKYTNYTPEFKGCLDYIFIESNKLAVTQVVPLTEEEELAKYNGLPNEHFPSDHLALVVDLKFK